MNFEIILQSIKDVTTQFLGDLETLLPRIINAAVIIVIGFILAWVVKTVLLRLSRKLDRIKVNEKYRGRLQRMHLVRSVEPIIKTIYWLIIIVFITVATEVIGLPIITTWLSGLLKYFPNLLIAIILITLGILGGKLFSDLIKTSQSTESFIYRNFLARFIQYSIVAISILMAIDQIGVDISLITNLIDIIVAALLFGACLAFGLGAKTSVSNILASYYLQSTYKVGHLIKIEEIEGRIIQIKANSVVIETKEGQMSIPAKKFSELVSLLVKKD